MESPFSSVKGSHVIRKHDLINTKGEILQITYFLDSYEDSPSRGIQLRGRNLGKIAQPRNQSRNRSPKAGVKESFVDGDFPQEVAGSALLWCGN